MSKMLIKATPEQQAWIAERGARRWAAVVINHVDMAFIIVSLHTSRVAAVREWMIIGNGSTPIPSRDFFDMYDFWVEHPIVEVCEVETQPVAEPVIHPSLNWIANTVWGWDYKDCHADNRKLVDLAKVNEHGNIDLSYQDLSHLRLNGAILDGADLSCATLICTDLRDANLKSANLSNALVVNSRFLYANLKLAKLTGVLLRKNDLSEAMLIGATIFPGGVCADNFSRHFITRLGSANGTLELYKCESGWHVRRGCFSGSLPEFLAAVDKKHGDNEHGKRYRAIVAALCD